MKGIPSFQLILSKFHSSSHILPYSMNLEALLIVRPFFLEVFLVLIEITLTLKIHPLLVKSSLVVNWKNKLNPHKTLNPLLSFERSILEAMA